MENYLKMIFKNASVTYYNSSLFFPREVRNDVTKLYAFVRVFDDLVDSIPQKEKEFYELKEKYYAELNGEQSGNIVLSNFVELMNRKGFKEEWVEAFLNAMESDLKKKIYYNIHETLKYMYGSAEVVGLMMMKLLRLKEESSYYARSLGRAMQYLNFIRDVKEDTQMGRQYLPLDEMEEFSVSSLGECTDNFREFIRFQLKRYFDFQEEAERGYRYIPVRYLVAIKTAADMYKWTANKIHNDPCILNRLKVKPKVRNVVANGMYNLVSEALWRFVSSYHI
ncbi:phytoene/squalene synthase family protein [Metallosphaera hakonensis]|uniref:Phytoene/squalene synthase family protein n=1 Tax=Metallosphaera hakonensis JCM 8857 = DSM 7519 TaxID=1293036 RepID=A0A2U9ITT3_9CREN|nr:phytoene/squalene synthase family protein [Metallosphaera hakonensis]AWR99385.1 phytoene/squalene synthase family protein [Metallosphaera hakonensis JCM 8857 = DSM 7519]